MKLRNTPSRSIVARLRTVACILVVAICAGVAAAAQPPEVLRFDEPLTAVINARAWDQTHHQWHRGKPGELYFDAVHRFLLLRFPESAVRIHRRLQEGYEIESVTLVLNYDKHEFRRAAGYAWRGYAYEDKEPPEWRAQAWLLRRPWTDDPEIGPTWNAYIRGAGYWRRGGGWGLRDRFQPALAEAPLHQKSPEARIDVTAAFTEDRFGTGTGERLRNAERHGFLLRRAAISHYRYGDRGLSTGIARLWVKEPTLVVTLRRAGEGADPGELPPAEEVRALAERLRADGGDGVPTTWIPENLDDLAAAWRERRRGDMPDWMWQRVQEVWDVPPHYGIDHGYDWFTYMMKALDSGDRERYERMIQKVLSQPPGWFLGHQHIEHVLPLILCPKMLPEVVRYHLSMSFQARWRRPLAPDKVFSHGKVTGMGTLNHMAQARPKALLGAEVNGLPWLARKAGYGLSLLNRQMIYSDGFSQEMGDSYYRGITLAPLQAAAKYAENPLMRLMADLMVEKLLFEDISTYHPGLRHRVSRIARRAGDLYRYVLGQDVPEAALHTLSRKGTLIHLEEPGPKPEVHGMRTFDLHATPPVRAALMAPWGDPWEANAIDKKPLPFRTVFSTRVMGRVQEPIHAITYMGQNYAMGSEEAYTSAAVPFFAAWRRRAEPVDHVEDFGVMFLRGRLNEQPLTWLDKTPFGMLQHDNKLIWAIKTQERRFVAEGHGNLPEGIEEGISSFKARVALMAYGPETEREVHVNGSKVTEFPTTARQGDLITIREGVSYIGLIPLPATDMGRDREVVIRSEHPELTLDSYVMDREEPVPVDDDATWKKLQNATAGWIVEFGDEAEHGSFGAFQTHMENSRIERRWDPEKKILHLAYESGGDVLEMGFRTTFERRALWHDQLNPSEVFAYRRVNGQWPWLEEGIALDNPLGQMGTAPVLRKGGATLRTLGGQMALLRVEPISGTYVGINPFIDPTPFELSTPGGITVCSDGPLGMGRVLVRPEENLLEVDYALPPPAGSPGIEELQEKQPHRFRPDVDVSKVRAQSARALRVSGFDEPPRVVLNGEELPGPFPRHRINGVSCIRVQIAQ